MKIYNTQNHSWLNTSLDLGPTTNSNFSTPVKQPIVKQKLKHQLEKEVNELKRQNKVLAEHQTPLPDDVENVKYNKDVGFFQGEITGKKYDAGKALKMKDHWERIHPQDQNTLKRIHRINYEEGHTNIKAPFIIEEEHKIKNQLEKGLRPVKQDVWDEYTPPKLANLPIVKNNINNRPVKRNYWDETVKLNAGNKGPMKLPKLTPEEIKKANEPSTWDLIKKTANTPQEISEIRKIVNDNHKKFPDLISRDELKYLDKKPEETKTLINDPGLNLIGRDLPTQDKRPIEEVVKDLADKRLEREQKDWDRKNGRGGISDLLRPE
tara:strand:+ start:240 stop:1205 length:966 start_codon:yes stop_codon:yes gene_type:complete